MPVSPTFSIRPMKKLYEKAKRISFDSLGIEFPWKGDTIIWVYPWRRKGKPKYISILLSGNGEFGDVRLNSLKEIDKIWEKIYPYER